MDFSILQASLVQNTFKNYINGWHGFLPFYILPHNCSHRFYIYLNSRYEFNLLSVILANIKND